MQDLLGREYPQFEVVWFGHIGDGNLHINVLKPDSLDDAAFVAQCERVTGHLAATLRDAARWGRTAGLSALTAPAAPRASRTP